MSEPAGQVPLTRKYIGGQMADVSAASSHYIVAPCSGTIMHIWTVLQSAITGANSALTFFINGTGITGSGITVTQSGSAAGDMDESVPTALNYVRAGDVLKITSDGASSTTAILTYTYEIETAP